MYSEKITVWVCEHCDNLFRNKEDCELHENKCPLKPYPETKPITANIKFDEYKVRF